jgi:hypothetical protein
LSNLTFRLILFSMIAEIDWLVMQDRNSHGQSVANLSAIIKSNRRSSFWDIVPASCRVDEIETIYHWWNIDQNLLSSCSKN